MNKYGFTRVTVCSPIVKLANPTANCQTILEMVKSIDSSIIVFPELCVTGYSCKDWFSHLLESSENNVYNLCTSLLGSNKVVIIGAPIPINNALYNCAIVIQYGQILGIVPKTFIPNYSEFEESRWFSSKPPAFGANTIKYAGKYPAFGTNILFKFGKVILGVEICEDLWMPIPPSSKQCLAGANLLVNLSASNEIVGKKDYRLDLVKNQSGRCIAGYAYASAGPTESSADVVFGGHCIIAENGHILAETTRVGHPQDPLALFGPNVATVDIDIDKLMIERRRLTPFSKTMADDYRIISGSELISFSDLKRYVPGLPYVPNDQKTLNERCSEIIGIQSRSLYNRLQLLKRPKVSIGVSGGLDSTLALLIAYRTFLVSKMSLDKIIGITMPGFATSQKTFQNSITLMRCLGITHKEIDIKPICHQVMESVDCKSPDVVFENIQARTRTLLLMSSGFVIGTGDLSEAALGWCTYNGDHMSMFNVNCGIPKTLVKFLVGYISNEFKDNKELHSCLQSILNTVISPELLSNQSTEEILGPYELHDFFLANFIRNSFSEEKVLWLAGFADFSKKYDLEFIKKTFCTFKRRFFANQFKRDCVPNGPKVGSTSLSPRGDWRMPSDIGDIE